MRYLGFDLGTKTLGVSVSDKTNTITRELPVIRFDFEDYDKALLEAKKVIDEYNITEVVLGLPKNMDGSLGFAAKRSLKFKELLENIGIVVHLVDERLTTKSALDILHYVNKTEKTSKNIIDSVSASIILESYLKSIKR
jgi:putative holliday junction resolvase